MEHCCSIQNMLTVEASHVGVKSLRRSSKFRFWNSSRTPLLQSQNIYGRRGTHQLIVSVSNTEARGFKHNGVSTGSPHRPGSPEGKFLSALLKNQRHLFQFAVSEQLNELASEKDEASARKKKSMCSMESVLQNRIAEIKEKEHQIAVEDVIYMSVVHKFLQVEVPMFTNLSECFSNNNLEIQPSEQLKLESVHSSEVQEMIREHLATILRMSGETILVDWVMATKIDRIDLGRIYASSVTYGYFLKSASFRREMDMGLTHTCEDTQTVGSGTYYSVADLPSLRTLEILRRSEKLSSYVKGFNQETLQRCAKLKSKEAVSVIEKHTWALFGDERLGDGGGHKGLVVAFSSLNRLVLEAVAFGSFLWDAERAVDCVYPL